MRWTGLRPPSSDRDASPASWGVGCTGEWPLHLPRRLADPQVGALVGAGLYTAVAVVSEQHDVRAEGYRYLGIDVLARPRTTFPATTHASPALDGGATLRCGPRWRLSMVTLGYVTHGLEQQVW